MNADAKAARGEIVAVIREPGLPDVVVPLERYCIVSGRPVGPIPGDRCLDHGGGPAMCATDVRPAQCQHLRLSPNHPQPHCSECGRDLPAAGASPATRGACNSGPWLGRQARAVCDIRPLEGRFGGSDPQGRP